MVVELLAECMSSAIEERPKSARQGLPRVSIRMLCYKNKNRTSVGTSLAHSIGESNCTNSLQVTVNDFVGMQVVQPVDDTK